METLLRITDTTCEGCGNRHTSSLLTNINGFPLSATLDGGYWPFSSPSGYYYQTLTIPRCHNCATDLPPRQPGTPWPTRHPSHDAPRTRPKAGGPRSAIRPISDDDLLGDL